MQVTRVESLERTIQKTNEWLKEIQAGLGAGDRRHAYAALRATLHVLRDRLPPNEALHLGAQLPTLIRGVYYEGWSVQDKPIRMRALDEFLGAIVADSGDPELDGEAAARTVFGVISEHVTPGEIDDVKANLPGAIRRLWPA